MAHGLGNIKNPTDSRDKLISAYLSADVAIKSGYVDHRFPGTPINDQGEEGACGGFAATYLVNAKPLEHRYDSQYAFGVYQEANPNWRNSSGSTLRANAKVLKRRGIVPAYALSESYSIVLNFLLNNGPVVIGVPWYNSMDKIDSNGFVRVRPDSGQRGRHAITLWGARIGPDALQDTDATEDYVFFPNSWGQKWGRSGYGRISLKGLKMLFDLGGDAVTMVEA